MPRRGFVPKREVLPDPVHGTTVVTKLINQIMLDGKRGVAQNVCYEAFDTIKEKTGKDANEVFQAALANVAPSLEVKARRVGGATYQVPIEIRPERRQTLALRSLCLSLIFFLAARPISLRVSCVRYGVIRWPCAGWSCSPASAARRPWRNVLPLKSWTLPTTPARL